MLKKKEILKLIVLNVVIINILDIRKNQHVANVYFVIWVALYLHYVSYHFVLINAISILINVVSVKQNFMSLNLEEF